ncbi:MAG TPA: glycosyltransferase family 39 protein [Paenirhodobacter sp.]
MTASRAGVWLPWMLALYFVAQALVRLWAGPGVQLDEAEILVMARDFRWGYGPQQPLYNWVQAGVFALFGINVAAMVVTKNVCLWLFYMLAFLGLRKFCDDRRAAVATLGLLFVPTIAWEAQRTLSHSVALMVTSAAFLWAVCGLLRRDSWAGWVVLGVTLGLGGLSKTNFWILPPAVALALLMLPAAPGRVRGPGWARGGALALVIAGAILIGPLWWSMAHRDLALMSVGKLYRSEGPAIGGRLLGGTFEVLEALVLSFVLLVPVALLARRVGRGERAPEAAVWLRRWLLWVLVVGLVLLAVVMTVAGATRVSPRWLLPLAIPGAAGVVLWALETGSIRGARLMTGAASAVAATALVGMAVIFGLQPSRVTDDYTVLHDRVQGLAAENGAVVTGPIRDLGALLAVGPDLPVMPPPPLGPGYPPGKPLVRLVEGAGDDTPPQLGATLRGRQDLRVANRINPAEGQDFAVELWDLP